MLTHFTRNWWILSLRGFFAILLGIAAFIWPDITLHILILLFGIFLFLEGIFSTVSSLKFRDIYPHWWLYLIKGLLSMTIGIIAWVWPGITALVILILIAAWAIYTGLIEIILAMRLHDELEGEWLLILSGVISLLFGLVLALQPAEGLLALTWLMGAFAIIFGLLLFILGFKLRQLLEF